MYVACSGTSNYLFRAVREAHFSGERVCVKENAVNGRISVNLSEGLSF